MHGDFFVYMSVPAEGYTRIPSTTAYAGKSFDSGVKRLSLENCLNIQTASTPRSSKIHKKGMLMGIFSYKVSVKS